MKLIIFTSFEIMNQILNLSSLGYSLYYWDFLGVNYILTALVLSCAA